MGQCLDGAPAGGGFHEEASRASEREGRDVRRLEHVARDLVAVEGDAVAPVAVESERDADELLAELSGERLDLAVLAADLVPA